MKIRPFEDRDYEAFVGITNRSFPEYAGSVEIARHDDSTRTDPKFFHSRWMLDDDRGTSVGVVEMNHSRGWFDPDRYHCELQVDPEHRRRGYGSALFDRVVAVARERRGKALIGNAKESLAESVEFLHKRGCVERQRSWESRLDPQTFDFAEFAAAVPRVAKQGIRITTLADELRKGDREVVLRKTFALEDVCRRDIPSVDQPTESSYEVFLMEVEGPGCIQDAFFLAEKDGEYLGLSNMWTDVANPKGIYQGLSGVHPAQRGKGIAMALKLETVKYAKAHGMRMIKTWNSTVNRPMLRINEAMGFEKQPVWIEFEKRL